MTAKRILFKFRDGVGGKYSKSEFALEHPAFHPIQYFCREFTVMNNKMLNN